MSLTDKIRGLLRERYAKDEWLFFEECASKAGDVSGTNFLDAYAVSKEAGKKHIRVAFEIKISRSDFLSELEKPTKRDFAYSVSNEFYFVAPKDVVKENEVPEDAGLLYATENSLTLQKKAPYRGADDMLSVSFVVMLLRQREKPSSKRKLFRYAGKEISRDELESIIQGELDSRLDRYFEAEVERQVKEALLKSEVRSERAEYALCEIERLLGHDYREGESLEKVLGELKKIDTFYKLHDELDEILRRMKEYYSRVHSLRSKEIDETKARDDDFFD